MKTRSILALLAAAALSPALCTPAAAQNPSGAPYPIPGLVVAPPTITSGSGPELDGYWCYPSEPQSADPDSLGVVFNTKTDVSDVYELRIELRRWQSGDDPKDCPGDYVDSQEYYPLSVSFSYIQPQGADPYWTVSNFIYLDPTKFPRGGTSCYRLVGKIYRQDFEGNTTVETVYSEPFYLGY